MRRTKPSEMQFPVFVFTRQRDIELETGLTRIVGHPPGLCVCGQAFHDLFNQYAT
jgi:hypothetical protein